MGCLFAIVARLFPRPGVLLIWPARPIDLGAAFGGFWLLPILGIILLPFTTQMYVLLWSPSAVLIALVWLRLTLALRMDPWVSGAQVRTTATAPSMGAPDVSSCVRMAAVAPAVRHAAPQRRSGRWNGGRRDAGLSARHLIATLTGARSVGGMRG